MYDLINNWDSDKKVNSGYGYRPKSATNGVGSTDHKGIDLSSSNYDIPAVMSGKVVANSSNSLRGNYISILGVDGYTTTYQHMASKSPLSVGSSVTEGQVIGTQGHTGASTGDHLHFEVKSASGFYVNPVDYLAGKLSTGNAVTDGVTDGYDRPINDGYGTGEAGAWDWLAELKEVLINICGKLIKIVAVAAVLVLAAVLFMKAFNINLI